MTDQFEQIYNTYKQQGERQAAQELSENQMNISQEQIIAVRKNEDDNIIAVQTNTGRVLDYVTAITEAKAGNLAHTDVFHRYGREILRSEPDGVKQNNLDQLPTF